MFALRWCSTLESKMTARGEVLSVLLTRIDRARCFRGIYGHFFFNLLSVSASWGIARVVANVTTTK